MIKIKPLFCGLSLVLSLGLFACADHNTGTLVPVGDEGGHNMPPISNPDPGLVPADPTPGELPAGQGGSGPKTECEDPNPAEPVPEPMTMLLFGSGLAGAAYTYRRRRKKAQ